VLIRQTRNYGNAVLKRIDELSDRSSVLSKEKKSFLTGTVVSILINIRNLFSDHTENIKNDTERFLSSTDSYKTSFSSANPMINSISKDGISKKFFSDSKEKEKLKSVKSNKSGKSNKSVKSNRSNNDIGRMSEDNGNGVPVDNTQLESMMRFIGTVDSEVSCGALCKDLINVMLRICSVKPLQNNNNNENNNNINNNNSNSIIQQQHTISSNTNTTNNNTNNTENKKLKCKMWDNLLAPEKFLVDQICSFLCDVGSGSEVLPLKWGEGVGYLAMQYWRVCEGTVVIYLVFLSCIVFIVIHVL
jgi:hypothetical protein